MKHALNILVSLGILGLLVWWADVGTVTDQLRGASVVWLGWALAALTAATVLMALRWQIVARKFEIDIGLSNAVAEYYIAQLVNLCLPGGIAGDVTRAVRARHGANLTQAAQSVAAERIIGQGVMFTVLSGSLVVALCVPGGLAWPPQTWLALLAGLGCVLAVIVLSRRSGATGRFLREVMRLLARVRLTLLSLVIAALLILSFYACARATGTTVPPAGWLTLVPLVLSAMLIPLSVGGWGWREGAAAALFPLIGATPSAGIVAGIAYGAMMIVAALPGLYFLWRSGAALDHPAQT